MTNSERDVYPSETEIHAVLEDTPPEPTDDIIQEWLKDLLPPPTLCRIKANPESLRRRLCCHETHSDSDSDGDRKVSAMQCNHYGCAANLGDPYVVVTHNQMMHHLKCFECAHIFPTGHLLDVHIREQHDSMFMVQVERGQTMYACMLKTCDSKRLTPQERKEHCIQEHSFPGKFRFFQLSNRVPKAQLPQEKPGRTDAHGREPKAIKGRRNKTAIRGSVKCETTAVDDSMAVDQADDEKTEVHGTNVFRNFSFGHQRMKTFQSYGKARSKKGSGQALEDLSALKNVLDEPM